MRRYLFLFLLAATSLSARTFTDTTSGRKLDAEVVRVDLAAGTVVLKRDSDGKVFTLPTGRLSKKDRDFLVAWAETAPGAKGASESNTIRIPANAGTDPANLPKNLYPRSKSELQSQLRKIEARPAGKLNATESAVLNRWNAYRYLLGLPEVSFGSKQTKVAQAAAKALAKLDAPNVNLNADTKVCLTYYRSGGKLPGAGIVDFFVSSPGTDFLASRAHRATTFHPDITESGYGDGIGKTKKFACLYTKRSKGKIKRPEHYPTRGFFPLAYLKGDAWSAYYPREFDEGTPAPSVQVIRLNTRPSELPDPSEVLAKNYGKPLLVKDIYVYKDACNFVPALPKKDKAGVYLVDIQGKRLNQRYLVELY